MPGEGIRADFRLRGRQPAAERGITALRVISDRRRLGRPWSTGFSSNGADLRRFNQRASAPRSWRSGRRCRHGVWKIGDGHDVVCTIGSEPSPGDGGTIFIQGTGPWHGL